MENFYITRFFQNGNMVIKNIQNLIALFEYLKSVLHKSISLIL